MSAIPNPAHRSMKEPHSNDPTGQKKKQLINLYNQLND